MIHRQAAHRARRVQAGAMQKSFVLSAEAVAKLVDRFLMDMSVSPSAFCRAQLRLAARAMDVVKHGR